MKIKMTEKYIRNNFEKALNSVEFGWELSNKLGYSFSKKDLINLIKLHKDNKCRDKIEELLTDCNFHYESSMLFDYKYEELEKELQER